jgi:hypothetical protein
MRCTEARKVIYLWRPGEVPEESRAELRRHLAACEACAAEFRSAEESFREVDSLRRAEPLLDDQGSLTAGIMREVEEIGRREGLTLQHLSVPRFRSSRVRLSLRFALTLLVGVLLVEVSVDAQRLVKLERRLQTQNPAGGVLTVPLQSGLIARSETLNSLLKVAGLRPDEARTLLDDLRARYPRLASITIDDGLDARERAILDTEGKAFLKEFEKLVRTGGNNE